MNVKKIFTLGTDRRSEEDFIEILLSYGIESVIDVRRIPKSKITTFNRLNLAELLSKERIDYRFLGNELGGLRKGGYTAYIATEDFMEGVSELESIAEGKRSAIICSERFPWKCHRKWISRELHRRGWIVAHIIDKGKVWTPK